MNLKKAQELMKEIEKLSKTKNPMNSDFELSGRLITKQLQMLEDAEDELMFLEPIAKEIYVHLTGTWFEMNKRIKELKEIIKCLKVSK